MVVPPAKVVGSHQIVEPASKSVVDRGGGTLLRVFSVILYKMKCVGHNAIFLDLSKVAGHT